MRHLEELTNCHTRWRLNYAFKKTFQFINSDTSNYVVHDDYLHGNK